MYQYYVYHLENCMIAENNNHGVIFNPLWPFDLVEVSNYYKTSEFSCLVCLNKLRSKTEFCNKKCSDISEAYIYVYDANSRFWFLHGLIFFAGGQV